MKTPWHRLLLQYGTAIAALTVIIIGGLLMLTLVGAAVILSKTLEFIR